MKYKILVLCKNTSMFADFVRHSDPFFNTVSTSDYLPDILGHFEFFNPDAFVCFLDAEYDKTLTMLSALKKDVNYNGAPIFALADSDTCDVIEEKSGFTIDVTVRRPITQDNLTLRITRYFDGVREAKERAEALARERQARLAEMDAKAELIAAKQKAEERSAIAAAVTAKKLGEFEGPEAQYTAAAAAPVAENKAPENQKKHILVVDDDRTILKMLKTALSEKYEVTTMANGIVVDKFLETKYVDLIILDYEMPVETGADVFRKIKKNPKTQHIPVCFLTGVTEREKILEVMSLKPHGYLLKPIDMDMLMSTISNLTE